MTKTQWNFSIDILMFLCMAAIAGIGFLMKYVLLPGKEAWVIYGKKVELSWLGLDRHDWGAIHLYLGFLLLGLLVLHIILHWQTIVSLWQKYVPAGRSRAILTTIFLLLCLVFLFLPFFIQPNVADAIPTGRGERLGQVIPEKLLAPVSQPGDAAGLLANGKQWPASLDRWLAEPSLL